MSLAIKRRVALAILAFSTIWPAAHYFVVERFNLNPWNWFGWAMYTQPSERILAYPFSPDGKPISSQLSSLTKYQQDSIMAAYRPWSLNHLELGDFDDPDEFAYAILDAFKTWDSVRIEVVRYGLERESASIQKRSTKSYEYSRAALGL